MIEMRRKIEEIKREDAEVKALSAQLNPHFIFNTLTTLNNLILKEENEKADKFLVLFSKLLRETLANSEKRLISLEEEIQLTRDFITLMKARFDLKDFIKFKVHIDNEINPGEIKVPPMMVQPYIENAIEHGFDRNESRLDNTLKMKIEYEANFLIVIIDDNGKGRIKKERNLNRPSGMEINKNRLAFYDIEVRIIDKKNKNNSLNGTQIKLIIPKNL